MTKYNKVNGEPEYFCDNPSHKKEKKAHGAVSIHFWNGSRYGFSGRALQLCDECAEDIIKHIKIKFKKDLIEIPEI